LDLNNSCDKGVLKEEMNQIKGFLFWFWDWW